jgi:hypothetical protein
MSMFVCRRQGTDTEFLEFVREIRFAAVWRLGLDTNAIVDNRY